jgi:hypothetical protein
LILAAALAVNARSARGEEPKRFRPEVHFPRPAVVYATIGSVERLGARLAGTLLGRILTDPGTRKALAGVRALCEETFQRDGAPLPSTGKTLFELLGLIRGELSFCIGRQPGALALFPQMAASLELGTAREEILAVVAKLAEAVGEGRGAPLPRRAIGDVEATVFPSTRLGDLHVATLGTHLVVTSNAEALRAIAEAYARDDDTAPADRAESLEPGLTRQLVVNDREVLILADTKAFREMFLGVQTPPYREQIEAILRATGLDRVASCAYALGFRDGGMEGVLRLGMPDGAGGVLAALQASLAPVGDVREALSRMPGEAREVRFLRLDAGAFLRELDRVLPQAAPDMADGLKSIYRWLEATLDISAGELQALGALTVHSFLVEPAAGDVVSDGIVLVRTEELAPYWSVLEKLAKAAGRKPEPLSGAGNAVYLQLVGENEAVQLAGQWTPALPEILIFAMVGLPAVTLTRADLEGGWTIVSTLPQAVLRYLDGPRRAPLSSDEAFAALVLDRSKDAAAAVVSRGGKHLLWAYNVAIRSLHAGEFFFLDGGFDPVHLPPAERFLAAVRPGSLRLEASSKAVALRGHRGLEATAGLALAGTAALAAIWSRPVFRARAGQDIQVGGGAAAPQAQSVRCAKNLKSLYVHLLSYSDKVGNASFPHSPEGSLATLQLVVDSEPQARDYLGCPAAAGARSLPAGQMLEDSMVGYEVVSWRVRNTAVDAVLAFDKTPCHRGGRHVLFTDSRVQWLEESAFLELLAKNRERFERGAAEAAKKKTAAPKRKKD